MSGRLATFAREKSDIFPAIRAQKNKSYDAARKKLFTVASSVFYFLDWRRRHMAAMSVYGLYVHDPLASNRAELNHIRLGWRPFFAS
jgi:hypothetical protein